MKDFNFFEPYIDTKKIPTHKVLILYIAISTVVLGLIIYPLANVFRINSINKNIAAMKIDLKTSNTYERLDIVKQKKKDVSEMEEKLLLLENADKIIEGRNAINDLLLEKITSRIPKDVFLKSLNILSDQIQIQGTATNNLAVACLESNLKSDEDFKDIYISNISLNKGLYNFSINFALKTVEENDIEHKNIKQNGTEQ